MHSRTLWHAICYDNGGSSQIRSTEQHPHEINMQVAEHSTDTRTLNIVLREIQLDTKCDKDGPLNTHTHTDKHTCAHACINSVIFVINTLKLKVTMNILIGNFSEETFL
ncbi:Hypothetical predicted protein [Octopus vulgaris]|uniref:Uncharacterized protein n=1 Tax=Octopus vulgaris TaxID=6645 RepID=A0AA36EYF6_OCTVU|nr:Hypothetical predicted protein [Octopus vulgaris]